MISPVGTADKGLARPSLRDLGLLDHSPSVETLGYSHPSLRDEDGEILARPSQLEWMLRRKLLQTKASVEKVCTKSAPGRLSLPRIYSSTIFPLPVIRGGACGGSSHCNWARIIL